jgi:hemerythrin-like domain-containing protein
MLLSKLPERAMADPIKAWHEEHMYFRRLLSLLQHELDVFATGDTPNYALMLEVIGYLRDWSDGVHHPREDAVFRRLAARMPDWQLRIARLEQEHRVIAHAGESLRRLLEEVLAGAVVRRSEVEVAAATYLLYYGNHIAKEEEDILPLARTEVIKKLWDYIKANGLQDAKDKRAINADAKLRPVFGKPQVSMFELAGLVGKHLS